MNCGGCRFAIDFALATRAGFSMRLRKRRADEREANETLCKLMPLGVWVSNNRCSKFEAKE